MSGSGSLDGMALWNGIELDGLVLHAGSLTLRPWQASDATAVRQIMADERMGRYLELPWPYSAVDAVEFVTQSGVAGRRDGSRIDCAIARNTDGALLGSVSLNLRSARRGGEIGYWVDAGSWRQGVATEAVQTLARFGFAHGLKRIEIACDHRNVASARVAMKSGFRYEGIARAGILHQGEPADLATFGRLPSDDGEPVKPVWPELPVLSDGVVSVRPLVAEDWPTVLAEGSNAESVAWGFDGRPMTETAARQRAAVAPLNRLVGRQAELVICDVASGDGAGILNLRQAGPPGVVALGYGIVPRFRGRRFTTRALTLVSDWALEAVSVRLELGCKVDNVASARSAEAAGFIVDAHYRSRLRNPDGSYSDEVGFSKVRQP
jgi:RimJ/RimL family protein N-acetyltransferase